MTKTDLILSLIQIIEPKTERDAVIKAAVIQLITPDEFQGKPAEPEQDEPKPKKKGRPPFERAKPGDKILDTHVGSASSLIACYDLGFDYVGFEIDEEYYRLATKRLEDVKAQVRFEGLFND